MSHWEVGKNYLIRTVTMINVGCLVAVDEHEIVITKASWIAETGRWMQAVANGDFREVEPFPPDRLVIIGRGSLIDAVQIDDLPTRQK